MNAEQIYRVLTTESFHKWYEGRFSDHIQDTQPKKDEILKDIARLFKLENENAEEVKGEAH